MKDAGVDTHAVIRTGMLRHHRCVPARRPSAWRPAAAACSSNPTDARRCSTSASPGRLTQTERLAFLRMMMTATMNDVRRSGRSLRDLGAAAADTDIAAVVKDLGLDGPPLDPTKLEPGLVAELQRVIKALLAYGARMPKSLMLYVKNLIFIDAAIASLAPELDMFAVVTDIAAHFATTHGAAIAAQLGVHHDE
ncbi:MAG: hypothetical protein R2710_05275 [Acidimicrobiales bacterium]